MQKKPKQNTKLPSNPVNMHCEHWLHGYLKYFQKICTLFLLHTKTLAVVKQIYKGKKSCEEGQFGTNTVFGWRHHLRAERTAISCGALCKRPLFCCLSKWKCDIWPAAKRKVESSSIAHVWAQRTLQPYETNNKCGQSAILSVFYSTELLKTTYLVFSVCTVTHGRPEW